MCLLRLFRNFSVYSYTRFKPYQYDHDDRIIQNLTCNDAFTHYAMAHDVFTEDLHNIFTNQCNFLIFDHRYLSKLPRSRRGINCWELFVPNVQSFSKIFHQPNHVIEGYKGKQARTGKSLACYKAHVRRWQRFRSSVASFRVIT